MDEVPDRPPPCLRCQWYQVTWDPGFPHSCRQFGIKSRQLPSMVVRRDTGHHCPQFSPNPNIRTD
jgi:hypothetical protein